jgi:hypothetical protein
MSVIPLPPVCAFALFLCLFSETPFCIQIYESIGVPVLGRVVRRRATRQETIRFLMDVLTNEEYREREGGKPILEEDRDVRK